MNFEGVAVYDAGLSHKIAGRGHTRQRQRKHSGDSTHFFDLGAKRLPQIARREGLRLLCDEVV
jgi:hypothetical protein